jgi:hypothetical protein
MGTIVGLTMRDNHKGLPEIINAYERDEHYFCSVSLTIGAETKIFEFGIDKEAYQVVKRILNLRPFEQLPGIKYRYFFSAKVGRQSTDPLKTHCAIRIEQDKKGKEFVVDAPEALIANLIWFFRVKDFKELAHLQEII